MPSVYWCLQICSPSPLPYKYQNADRIQILGISNVEARVECHLVQVSGQS